MRIRETTTISSNHATFDQAAIMAAVAELDAQYRDGEIEAPAYFAKKRALIKML